MKLITPIDYRKLSLDKVYFKQFCDAMRSGEIDPETIPDKDYDKYLDATSRNSSDKPTFPPLQIVGEFSFRTLLFPKDLLFIMQSAHFWLTGLGLWRILRL